MNRFFTLTKCNSQNGSRRFIREKVGFEEQLIFEFDNTLNWTRGY